MGVDWGKEKIKLAVIEHSRRHCVQGLFSLDIQPEALTGPEVSSDLVAELSQLADDAGIRDENIVLAVEGNFVSLRHLKISIMPKRDLVKVIKWEVHKLFSGRTEEIIYRYSILGELKEDNKIYFNILLITVSRTQVKKYYNVFQSAGLKLAIFDIPALALWSLYKEGNKENIALVYLSAGMIHLVFMQYDKVYFIRSLPKYDLQFLLKQLQITLQHTKHTYPIPPAQKIILAGEFDDFPGLDCLIEEKTQLITQYFDPDIMGLLSFEPEFGVALGLALRGVMSRV